MKCGRRASGWIESSSLREVLYERDACALPGKSRGDRLRVDDGAWQSVPRAAPSTESRPFARSVHEHRAQALEGDRRIGTADAAGNGSGDGARKARGDAAMKVIRII